MVDPGDEFGYTFDLGDNWRQHCVVDKHEIDPENVLGVVPDRPLPYWGWGAIPDPDGRLFDGDDGETRIPDTPHEPRPSGPTPQSRPSSPDIAPASTPSRVNLDVDQDDET